MNGKRVFVTGGAGVIGLEMIPLLVARRAEVLVGDLKPRPAGFDPAVRYRHGDLNEMTAGELADFAPDVVIHLAATFERSAESYEFWDQNFLHNVALSHHVMTIAKDQPSVSRVVFASSYLIYDPALYQFDAPPPAPVALRESDPVLPRNLTGMAKLAHEVELRFLDGFCADRFSTVCARIYRGYGRNSRDIVSRWIRALLTGQEIAVYRPEGVFDYIYARDSAEGLIRLAETDATGIINLGTGRSRSVEDVLAELRRHFPDMRARREQSDIPFEASQADITRYRAEVGWAPEYDLDRSIPEIIAFERARLGGAKATLRPGNLLISSASGKVGLVRAAKAAAARLGNDVKVIAGDFDPAALSRFVADDFWQMPRTDTASVAKLIAGCRERGIAAILPTRDGELAFWAQHAAAFADAGIAVIVSPPATIERCLDKLAFARFGAEHGLPFIPAATDPSALDTRRLVVKERFGAGSRSIGLDLDSAAATAHAATLEAPIFQPFVPGTEISIDAWADREHAVKAVVLRRRDRVVNGESQVTTTFRDPAIEATVNTVLGALELSGPVVLQAMIDDAGAIHVIECNSRFGGASTLGIAAGCDGLYWSLLEAFGGDVAALPFQPATRPIRQVRMPADTFVHDLDL